jgi:hypothetical protein
MASRWARVLTWALVKACAWATDAAWVKWTTYSGAWLLARSSSMVSCSGVLRYS